jgi:ribonuclease HI
VAKQKHYVVWKGRTPGIYSNWPQAEAQVKGFAGAEFKSFESRSEAELAYTARYADYKGKKVVQRRLLVSEAVQRRLLAPEVVADSYAVDAACSGNPGVLEYRCVHTQSREELFAEGPFSPGTNNIGEFLAIVECLMWCQRHGDQRPIYSDSVNALGWVKARQARTNLSPEAMDKELAERLKRAQGWLAKHTYPNRLIKWDTAGWGENPADYGRK